MVKKEREKEREGHQPQTKCAAVHRSPGSGVVRERRAKPVSIGGEAASHGAASIETGSLVGASGAFEAGAASGAASGCGDSGVCSPPPKILRRRKASLGPVCLSLPITDEQFEVGKLIGRGASGESDTGGRPGCFAAGMGLDRPWT